MVLLSKKKHINITSLYFRLGFFNVILKGRYVEKNTAFKIYEVQKGNKVHWVEISILTKDYSPITTKEDRHDEPVEKLGQEKKWSVGNVDDEGVKGSEMRQESTMLLICFCREKQINARGNRHFWMFSVRVQVEDMIRVCVWGNSFSHLWARCAWHWNNGKYNQEHDQSYSSHSTGVADCRIISSVPVLLCTQLWEPLLFFFFFRNLDQNHTGSVLFSPQAFCQF